MKKYLVLISDSRTRTVLFENTYEAHMPGLAEAYARNDFDEKVQFMPKKLRELALRKEWTVESMEI